MCWPDQAQRKHREQRQAVEIARVRRRARRAGAAERENADDAVRRHERVGDHDVVRAGSGERARVPGVLDRVVAPGEKREHGIGLGAPLSGWQHDEEDRAGAEIDAAREFPASGEPESAALLDDGGTGGQERGGDRRRRIVAPHLALRRVGEHANHPAMRGEDAHDPGRRDAAPRERRGDIGLGAVVELEPAPARRLQHALEAGVAEQAIGRRGEMAARHGLRRALGEQRHLRACGGEELRLYRPAHRGGPPRRSSHTAARSTRRSMVCHKDTMRNWTPATTMSWSSSRWLVWIGRTA